MSLVPVLQWLQIYLTAGTLWEEFVGQRIGRDQDKIDGLTWTMLDAAEWNAILQEFKEFVVVVKFPDDGKWRMENRTDVSGKPYGKYCSGGSSDGASDGIQKLQG